MSEVRRVRVGIKDLESVKEACNDLDIEVNQVRDGIFELKNHGIKTYANSPVYLEEINGVYHIKADDYGNGIVDLNKKIKKVYNQKLIVKQAKKLGYSIVEKKQRNGKTVLKLRTFR